MKYQDQIKLALEKSLNLILNTELETFWDLEILQQLLFWSTTDRPVAAPKFRLPA